jgi:Flp pilus assembly protein TadD
MEVKDMQPEQQKDGAGARHRWKLAATMCFAMASALAHAQGGDAETAFNTGLDHLRQGHPAQALEEMRRAVKKEPKNAYYQKGLGLAHLAMGQNGDAIAAFRKALDLNPNYVDARNDLGTALLLAGKRDEGKRELLRVFSEAFNPRPDITARNIGNAYYEDKDYASALTWFETSAKKNKRFPEAYVGMGMTLVALGRVDDAIARLEEGLSETAEDINVLAALGEAYYRAGRFVDARTRLERAVQKNASSPAGQRAAELLRNFPR